MQPREAADYPRRSDLRLGNTSVDAELYLAMHHPSFASERFAKGGERFCYLKIDGADGGANCRWSDRAEGEAEIEAHLRARGAGTVTGGGTGLRYSYIDLLLTDPDASLPALRALLRDARLPKRSWLLFFDPDCSEEWLGVHPASPPPPADDSE